MWAGHSDQFFNPGQGILTFNIEITNPGNYKMSWRNFHYGPDAGEELEIDDETLIEAIAKTTKMEKTKAKAAVETMIDVVTKELKKGGKVQLTGFGTFATSKRKKRMGVNPKTGAKITIPARKVPKFTAGKALKDAVS